MSSIMVMDGSMFPIGLILEIFWGRLGVNSTKMGFLLHVLEDRSFSVGHSPARPYSHDDNRELIFKMEVCYWKKNL